MLTDVLLSSLFFVIKLFQQSQQNVSSWMNTEVYWVKRGHWWQFSTAALIIAGAIKLLCVFKMLRMHTRPQITYLHCSHGIEFPLPFKGPSVFAVEEGSISYSLFLPVFFQPVRGGGTRTNWSLSLTPRSLISRVHWSRQKSISFLSKCGSSPFFSIVTGCHSSSLCSQMKLHNRQPLLDFADSLELNFLLTADSFLFLLSALLLFLLFSQ